MANLSWKKACAVFVLCAATAIAAGAQTFTNLVNFDQTNGANPFYGSLIQGIDGNFYGTTSTGGDLACNAPYGCGTIFKITPAGMLTTVHMFESGDGFGPTDGPVLGTDGAFYGTTVLGGANNYGTIFKITTRGALTTLHSFNSTDGSYPYGALIEGADGSFYGTTKDGGNPSCDYDPIDGCGTVFRITPGGTFTTLHAFEFNDGAFPMSGLTHGTGGNFYGTTSGGGNGQRCGGGCGTAFTLTAEGTLTTLHIFCARPNCTDGMQPEASLIQATDRQFYGTTTGGPDNYCCGIVFQLTSRGKFSIVDGLKKSGAVDPIAGLIQATDGNLYGTTVEGGDLTCSPPDGCGAIFRIVSGGALSVLYNFEQPDGVAPVGAMLQATNGTFYGTTEYGGTTGCFDGCGTVFSFSEGLGPFVAFVRAYGKVGQTGGVLGQGFTGTTSVSFNGTPASFTVVSDTFMKATVPAGATTGFVTVTTPSGTLTSNVPFRVIQ
jgi:uncharacterized repeat protein (TIGR03803 family)